MMLAFHLLAPRPARLIFLAMMVGFTSAAYPHCASGPEICSDFHCDDPTSLGYQQTFCDDVCGQKPVCSGEAAYYGFNIGSCTKYPSCIASLHRMPNNKCSILQGYECYECCYNNPAPPPNRLPRPPPRPPPPPPLRCLPLSESNPQCSARPGFTSSMTICMGSLIGGECTGSALLPQYPPGFFYCCGSSGNGYYCQTSSDCPLS